MGYTVSKHTRDRIIQLLDASPNVSGGGVSGTGNVRQVSHVKVTGVDTAGNSVQVLEMIS